MESEEGENRDERMMMVKLIVWKEKREKDNRSKRKNIKPTIIKLTKTTKKNPKEINEER
jgi:hypothetical protein